MIVTESFEYLLAEALARAIGRFDGLIAGLV